MCGNYLFPHHYHPEGAEFESDAHRRQAWAQHKDTILAQDWPGSRPKAFWDYDRRWPDGAVSEMHAIWLLPDTSAAERAAIEAAWLEQMRLHISFPQGHPNEGDRRVPSWFYAEHEATVRATLRAGTGRAH